MSRRFGDVDLTQTMSSLESQPRIASAQKRLLHLRLFSAGLLGPAPHAPGLVVLFEGFDAAGKVRRTRLERHELPELSPISLDSGGTWERDDEEDLKQEEQA